MHFMYLIALVMTRNSIFIFLLAFSFRASAQDEEAYLKQHAVKINNPEQLNDSVYNLLSPFQMIMFGEMHGTNESTPFVNGLANLLTSKGDSVLVGLEIPPVLMTKFISLRTDSSIYQSDFFSNPPFYDGRESFAWANLISTLNKNTKVKIFFFDRNTDEGKEYQRDSLMYSKIKIQFKQHPTWKIITLSGNFHNRISGETTMAGFLKEDKELNLSSKLCSINMEYKEGSCNANFTHGLEVKQLGSYPSVYNSTSGYDRYLILLSAESNYPYTGFYYTRFITAAQMVSQK